MHPLLLFVALFLPGIVFVSSTLSVKKTLAHPILDHSYSESQENIDSSTSADDKNNRWSGKEEKIIDLIFKKIIKEYDFKEFEKVINELANIKKEGKNKVNKKYILPFNKKDIFNFDSASVDESKQEVNKVSKKETFYEKTEAPIYEKPKNKLDKTSFDASIELSPKKLLNDQSVEKLYSVKMDVQPIFQDQFSLSKSSSRGDNSVEGFNFEFFNSGPGSVPKKSEVDSTKNWSSRGKSNTKQGRMLLKNIDLEINNGNKLDELQNNEIPNDDLSSVKLKMSLSPKYLEQEDRGFSPVKSKSMVESQEKIVTNNPPESLLKTFEEINHDTVHSNKESSDKTVEIPANNIAFVELNKGRPTPGANHDNFLLNAPLHSNEDQNITLSTDNKNIQANSTDPHLEELSFWNRFIVTHLASLLNFPRLV